MAEGAPPTEEELREALGRLGVADVLVNALSAAASLGFHRVSPEARDLPQARLAIEALRALEPVLQEGGVEESLVRDLAQARASLQLAYAQAVAERAESPQGEAGDTQPASGDTQPASGDEPPASGDEPPASGDEPPASGDEPRL